MLRKVRCDQYYRQHHTLWTTAGAEKQWVGKGRLWCCAVSFPVAAPPSLGAHAGRVPGSHVRQAAVPWFPSLSHGGDHSKSHEGCCEGAVASVDSSEVSAHSMRPLTAGIVHGRRMFRLSQRLGTGGGEPGKQQALNARPFSLFSWKCRRVQDERATQGRACRSGSSEE